jgi:hypothetical protein
MSRRGRIEFHDGSLALLGWHLKGWLIEIISTLHHDVLPLRTDVIIGLYPDTITLLFHTLPNCKLLLRLATRILLLSLIGAAIRVCLLLLVISCQSQLLY